MLFRSFFHHVFHGCWNDHLRVVSRPIRQVAEHHAHDFIALIASGNASNRATVSIRFLRMANSEPGISYRFFSVLGACFGNWSKRELLDNFLQGLKYELLARVAQSH